MGSQFWRKELVIRIGDLIFSSFAGSRSDPKHNSCNVLVGCDFFGGGFSGVLGGFEEVLGLFAGRLM